MKLQRKWFYEKDKYLLLGDDTSMKHVGQSTLAGKAVVLVSIMYALALIVVTLVWCTR